jgi:phage terminase small subunit
MAKKISIGELQGLSARHANFVVEYCKDYNARRAAVVVGYESDTGPSLLQREDVQESISKIVASRLEVSHIDAEWALMEAVDNHLIARQRGNITASNTALGLVMKHTMVDAFAAQKVDLATDSELVERLRKGRARAAGIPDAIVPEIEAEEQEEVITFL